MHLLVYMFVVAFSCKLHAIKLYSLETNNSWLNTDYSVFNSYANMPFRWLSFGERQLPVISMPITRNAICLDATTNRMICANSEQLISSTYRSLFSLHNSTMARYNSIQSFSVPNKCHKCARGNDPGNMMRERWNEWVTIELTVWNYPGATNACTCNVHWVSASIGLTNPKLYI